MHDGVADVLAERARLDRGASLGIVVSVLLHGALAAAFVYAATHASAPVPASVINIQFANVAPAAPAGPAAEVRPSTPAPAPEPKVEEKKPELQEPKPAVPEPPKKPEKNTVPLDPFGRSTKKGSEKPAVEKAAPAPAAPGTGTTMPEVPVGGSGITGLEGGDFPYTIYLQGMQRRIGGNWFRPPGSFGTGVVISFRIQRDGTINEAKVVTSSGNGTFDRAALSAVRNSTPLNPLPYSYNGTYLGVTLTFK